jgi:hypothetical protein
VTSVIPEEIRGFVESAPVGVLRTIRPEGGPRLATVAFVLREERIFISSELQTAKVRDVRRSERGALCVHGCEPPFPPVALHGPARLLSVGSDLPRALSGRRFTGKGPRTSSKTKTSSLSVGL